MEATDLKAHATFDLLVIVIALALLAVVTKAAQKRISRHITVSKVWSIWLIWLFWRFSAFDAETDKNVADHIQKLEDMTFQHTAPLWRGLSSPLEGFHLPDFFGDVSVMEEALIVMLDDLKTRDSASTSEIEEGSSLMATWGKKRENFLWTWHNFCANTREHAIKLAQDAVVFQNGVARDIWYEMLPQAYKDIMPELPHPKTPTGLKFRCQYQDVPGISKRIDIPPYPQMVMWKIHRHAQELFNSMTDVMNTFEQLTMAEDEAHRFLHPDDDRARGDTGSDLLHDPSRPTPATTREEWYASLTYFRTNLAILYTDTKHLTGEFPLSATNLRTLGYDLPALEDAMSIAQEYDTFMAGHQADIIQKRMERISTY